MADNINIVLRAIIDANKKDINAQIATLSTKIDKLKIKLDLDTDGLKNIQYIMQDIKKLMTFNNSKFKLFDGEQIKKDGIKVYDTLESIEKKYKKLGQPITYTDKTFDTITKELTGFTMQVEKADGVIEKLKYSLINISNGTDISKGFVLQGMNQIDKTAQIQEKALQETQRIKLRIQQEEEKASERRMNLLHKEALAMNKVFDKNKMSGSTTNTNASSSAIISQISSIDKLILRYKAAQMSLDEFLKYGNKIVASDNFRNKSLEQQAKLIQALEGAERKLIQTRTQASNVGERQAKLSTQENMKMLNEAYAMNRAFDAEKQRTFNLGTNLTGKTSGFTGADKGSVEKYAKEIYGADAAVIKFNQTLDKNGKLVSEATVKVNKNAKEYSEYKLKVDQATQSVNQFGGSTDKKKDLGMFDQFKVAMEKFPIWIVASTLFMQSINAVRDGLKYVLDMDTALTNLSKVTTLSSEQLDEMRVVAVNLGGDLARSSTEIMKSMAEFGRVFKDTESITELSKVAVMTANVTTLSADEAAKALNTTMITFKKNVGDASHILDSFNEIQNNFRTSAEDLAASIGKIGAAAVQAGLSMEQLEGYTTAIVSATGIDGSETGTALKGVISRVFRIGSEGESDAGKSEKALNQLGVAVRKNANEFRDFDSILKDLQSKWDTLTNVQKSNIAQVLAGTWHYSKFIALMDNFDIATSATEKALNSQGSALKENQKYIESLEGRLNILKLAFEGAYSKIFNSETLKGFIDGLSKLVKVFGSIPGIVGLATTALILFKGKAITSGIVAVVSYISTLTTLALTEGVVRTATMELSLAFNTLKVAFLSNPIGILALALTSIIGIMALFGDSTDKAASSLAKLDEQISAIKEQQSTIKTLASTYETLSIKTSLSSDEHKELFDVQNDIAKLAPSLVEYYDSEGNAILKTKDELDKYIESLKTEQAIKESQKRDTYIQQLEDEQNSIDKITHKLNVEKATIDLINSKKVKNGQISINYMKITHDLNDSNIEGYIDQDKALEIVNKRIASFNNQLKNSFDTMQNLKNQIKQGIPEFTTLSGISKQIADNLAINVDQQFENLNSDNVKDYTDAIKDIGITLKDNKIDEQFNEYTKLTDAYQNNKLSIEEMTKAYDSLKKSLSGVGVNSKDQQKFLQLPDPSAIEFVIEKTEELDSAYKDITSDIGNLNQTVSDLNEGESLNNKTLEELILKYPELEKYLVKTAEGYTLEKSALDILNKARETEVQNALLAQAGITQAVYTQLKSRLEAYEIEIGSIESLSDAYKTMMPYMAAGSSGEIIDATIKYGLAMEKLQALKKLLSDTSYGVSTTKKKGADPSPIPYQDLSAEFVKAYNAQAELDENLAKSLEKQIKIADSAKDYNKEIELTNKLIDVRKKKITDLQASNKKITSDADRVRSTTNRDTSKWFDPNGFETSTYLNLIKSFEGKTDNASKRELDNIKRIFEALKNLKQGYMANNQEISDQIDLIDEQRQNIKKLNDEKLKMYEEAENQIVDLLKKSHQKELDGLKDSLDKYKNYIDEKKKILDKYYDDIDYKEKVAEDSNNILDAQNEINKYSRAAADGDLEAINKIKELKEQQLEDEKSLAKTQRDHEKDLRKENLDSNLSNFEKFIDSQEKIQEDALQESALKLEAQKILTNKTLGEVQNAIVNLFTITSENATTAGLVIQNNLLTNLQKVLDIYKELGTLTGSTALNSVVPKTQGLVLPKTAIASRLKSNSSIPDLIPNLNATTPKTSTAGTGNVSLVVNVDTVTKESLPGLKNTMSDALRKLRNELYNKGQK